MAFITGLTTGGISCFAVQGSLLMSSIIREKNENSSKRLVVNSLVLFLLAKLLAYTILGLLLGILGSLLTIPPKIQGLFQIIIGVYLLIVTLNLINIHPFFKKFVITPPKFVFRILKNQSKDNSVFTPIFLGLLTILIPCGITQGMMLLAVSAASPLTSLLLMFSFTLGTIPIFFLIGLATTELLNKKAFTYIAALVVGILAIISINSGQILRGSAHTIQNYWRVAFDYNKALEKTAPIIDGYQEVTITVKPHGYEASANILKIDVPVKLTLVTNSIASCSRAFTIPDYKISKVLPVTGVETIIFTPEKLGNITYTCSMGMYSGYFDIIN